MRRKGLFSFDAKKVAEVSSLGLVLPSSIAIGLFMGYFLDKLLGTHPWLLIIFLLFGIASGFYSLLRGLNKYLDKNKDI
jgi:ATP synthase protein I